MFLKTVPADHKVFRDCFVTGEGFLDKNEGTWNAGIMLWNQDYEGSRSGRGVLCAGSFRRAYSSEPA